MRDNQRSKVYAAEQLVRRILDRANGNPTYELHGSTLVLEPEIRFGDLAATQSFVAAVQSMPWYREAFPTAEPIAVRQRRGNAKAHYSRQRREIAVHATEQVGQAWSLRSIVLLHEMAHHVSDGVSHDGKFCTVFVEHVRQVIGENVAHLLWVVLQEEGCETSSP